MLNLSICITTLNACNYLQNCLRSINEQSDYLQPADGISNLNLPDSAHLVTSLSKLSFELIIVDNGSTDGTIEMLHQEYPNIKLILNGKNDGFAKPMNQAMRGKLGRFFSHPQPRHDHPAWCIKRIGCISGCPSRCWYMWSKGLKP